jgi:hypothetical protein
MSETAFEIVARNLAKARGLKAQEEKAREGRLQERKTDLQKFFARHPDIQAWAEDMKAHFGDKVRVRSYGEKKQESDSF